MDNNLPIEIACDIRLVPWLACAVGMLIWPVIGNAI